MEVENSKDDFITWLESDKGQAFIEKQKKKKEIKENRYERFENWLKENDFDKLLYRLILEHNYDYREKCYHKGYMPYPNRKLTFLLNYICDNLATINVNELDCAFPNQIWLFRGYYFQLVHGQGTIVKIYNKDDMRLILQV
jgi:hypothetical protein